MSWNDSQNEALANFVSDIHQERVDHNGESRKKKIVYYVLSITVIFLTTLVTLITSATPFCGSEGPLSCEQVQWAVFAAGVISGVSTGLGILNTFLNYGKRYTHHQQAEAILSVLERAIERAMYQNPRVRGSWDVVSSWIMVMHNGITIMSPSTSVKPLPLPSRNLFEDLENTTCVTKTEKTKHTMVRTV